MEFVKRAEMQFDILLHLVNASKGFPSFNWVQGRRIVYPLKEPNPHMST